VSGLKTFFSRHIHHSYFIIVIIDTKVGVISPWPVWCRLKPFGKANLTNYIITW
jgi:hypothetical protein